MKTQVTPEPVPCMADEERDRWREANRTMTKDTRARIPCEDCMVDFAIVQGMDGKCLRFDFRLHPEVAAAVMGLLKQKETGETVLEP